MILGSRMENPSVSGQAGIRIQDCSLPARESRSASALESAILAGLAGVGTIGDPTGATVLLSTTTTPTFPTAESSPITTRSIVGAPTSIMAAVVTPAEVTGNSVSFLDSNLRNGERNHAHEKSDTRNF